MTAKNEGPLLYLSSPLGFSEAARGFMLDELQPLLVDRGFRVLNPWVLNRDVDREMRTIREKKTAAAQLVASRKLTHTVGAQNFAALDACDVVLAVLDGVDVDSGVAAEAGYAFRAGKTIHGLATDRRLVHASDPAFCNAAVQYIIEASGGRFFPGLAALRRAWKPKPGGATLHCLPKSD